MTLIKTILEQGLTSTLIQKTKRRRPRLHQAKHAWAKHTQEKHTEQIIPEQKIPEKNIPLQMPFQLRMNRRE